MPIWGGVWSFSYSELTTVRSLVGMAWSHSGFQALPHVEASGHWLAGPGHDAPACETPRKWKSLSCVWLFDPHGLYSPWNSPGENTGVGRLSVLQKIFPTQGLNCGLPHCGKILYQLSHKGNPKNTGVGSLVLLQQIFTTQESKRGLLHCSGFFTNWAIREALKPLRAPWLMLVFWWVDLGSRRRSFD